MSRPSVGVREYFERILGERDRNDAERNKRLDERFEAQEKAVQFALTEREKAVNAALIAAKEAVSAALIAGAGADGCFDASVSMPERSYAASR